MIPAGAMNRRIRIEASSETRDPESNELIRTWSLLAEVWAHRRDTTAREFFAAGSEHTEQVAVFTIWHREGVTQAMRLIDRGQIFDITGTSELGQRQQLQLQAVASDSERQP